MSSAQVSKDVTVKVEWVDDEVITRCFEDPTWAETFYLLGDRDAVLDHLSYNCINNGVEDANRLDGWADLDRGQLTMEIIDIW